MSKKAFSEQRANAKQRGIPFSFTYESWVAWWTEQLGEDWAEKRGRAGDKYCMARMGDEGPYTPGNVKCIRFSENLADAAANDKSAFGERAGHARLTAAMACEIYRSHQRIEDLSYRHGVSAATIIDIRCRRTWCRATADLQRVSLRGRNQWA